MDLNVLWTLAAVADKLSIRVQSLGLFIGSIFHLPSRELWVIHMISITQCVFERRWWGRFWWEREVLVRVSWLNWGSSQSKLNIHSNKPLCQWQLLHDWCQRLAGLDSCCQGPDLLSTILDLSRHGTSTTCLALSCHESWLWQRQFLIPPRGEIRGAVWAMEKVCTQGEALLLTIEVLAMASMKTFLYCWGGAYLADWRLFASRSSPGQKSWK